MPPDIASENLRVRDGCVSPDEEIRFLLMVLL